jgi:hypothetical protein
MISMITQIAQATPEWFTQTLRQAGVLGAGAVLSAETRANPAFNSAVAHFALRYAGPGPHPPAALLLKLTQNDDGALEIAFYEAVRAFGRPLPMLARCLAAEYDPASGSAFLLLEDYSATHAPPVERAALLACEGVPPDPVLDGIVAALAGFHAAWWQHPALGTNDALMVRPWFRDAAHYTQHIARRQREWAEFDARLDAELPDDLRALIVAALAGLPRLWETHLAARVESFRQITLSQGDCYLTQFLCPTAPGERTLLVDFDSASANFAAYDLAYLLPTFWTPAQRAEGGREQRALERYHAALCTAGVENYTFADLHTDYRHMVVHMLFDPIHDAVAGSSRAYWWPKLQCLAGAFRDLDCAALLG